MKTPGKKKKPEQEKYEGRRLKQLDDKNIPVVIDSETAREFENRTGHGFYGCERNGYISQQNAE